jgi:hypothetical protein
MAWRLDRESVRMPFNSCDANVVNVLCMATSSARMMVRVSFVPVTDMYTGVLVGMWTTAAPNRGWPVMSDPLVYT